MQKIHGTHQKALTKSDGPLTPSDCPPTIDNAATVEGATRTPASLVLERCDISAIDRLADDWRQLCQLQGRLAHPFAQPEWIRAFHKAFIPKATMWLLTLRRVGHLVGVLPICEQQRLVCGIPARILASPTNPHSYWCEVVATDDAPEATCAIWSHLAARSDWDLIALEYVPEDGRLMAVVNLARGDGYRVEAVESFASPYFPLTPCADHGHQFVPHLPGAFRRDLQRRARRLRERGEVRLVRHDNPGQLHRFYELEAGGWKGKAGTSILSDPSTRRFYDEVAEGAARRGQFVLYFLELDGHPISGHYGLAVGQRYFVPKLAFDERYSAYSPGHLLVNAVAGDSAARGLIEFDFLGEEMAWKAPWAIGSRRLRRIYIFRRSMRGAALFTAMFGAKSAAKRLLGRHS